MVAAQVLTGKQVLLGSKSFNKLRFESYGNWQPCQAKCCAVAMSQAAWHVCTSLLAAAGTETEHTIIAFAAADILLAKVRQQFSQLRAEDALPLRDSVMTFVRKFAPVREGAAHHPAFNRLCMVVAALALQMPGWSATELLTSLVSTDPLTFMTFIEILTILPEEVHICLCNCWQWPHCFAGL